MNTVKNLKNLTTNNFATTFAWMYESIERRISFNFKWRPSIVSKDLSGMIKDPDSRLILQPREVLSCEYECVSSVKNRLTRTDCPIVVMGTPYGPLMISFSIPVASLTQTDMNVFPYSEVHMTRNLEAALFAILRTKADAALWFEQAVPSHQLTIQNFAKFLMLTDTFFDDLEEQAAKDRAAGVEVTDGFPPLAPRPPRPIKVKPIPEDKKDIRPKQVNRSNPANRQHTKRATQPRMDNTPSAQREKKQDQVKAEQSREHLARADDQAA